MLTAAEVAALAAKLREVCADVLAVELMGEGGERSAFLVALCVRVLAEPGYAERVVANVARVARPR